MTPYYQDETITIYHADFREVMVDPALLVADPPFDIWRSVVDDVAKIRALSTVAFTNWQNRDALALLGRPRAELVWTFADGRWVSHELPRITHETILVYGRVGSAYVGRSMVGVPSQRKGAGSVGRDKMPDRTWQPRERALLDSHVAYPRNVSSGVWTKPTPLMEQLVEWLTLPGELIFDPFMGGGSVLVAAKNLGRQAIGCDVDEISCERAATRCQQEVLGLIA